MSETTPTAITPRRPRQPECRLTDQQLADLITRERPYKVFDGNSLFVLVTPSGQRPWRWRYYIRGWEKMLLLGSYPEVSLQQARAARDQARDKVQTGIDPADEKREAKLALLVAQESSFEAVARAWHSRWDTGRHARYAEDVMSRLERNVFPVLGHKPVDQIEPKHVVAMMERVGRAWSHRRRLSSPEYLQSGVPVCDHAGAVQPQSRLGIQAFRRAAATRLGKSRSH